MISGRCFSKLIRMDGFINSHRHAAESEARLAVDGDFRIKKRKLHADRPPIKGKAKSKSGKILSQMSTTIGLSPF